MYHYYFPACIFWEKWVYWTCDFVLRASKHWWASQDFFFYLFGSSSQAFSTHFPVLYKWKAFLIVLPHSTSRSRRLQSDHHLDWWLLIDAVKVSWTPRREISIRFAVTLLSSVSENCNIRLQKFPENPVVEYSPSSHWVMHSTKPKYWNQSA